MLRYWGRDGVVNEMLRETIRLRSGRSSFLIIARRAITLTAMLVQFIGLLGC